MGIAKESVTVYRRRPGHSVDEFGNEVREYDEETVDGVYVDPDRGDDVSDPNRPNSVATEYTLYFPRGYDGDISLCDVMVRGKRCSVVGSAEVYPVTGRYFKYSMVAKVRRLDG